MAGAGNIGERLAGLEGEFKVYTSYSHEKWHKLNNDLQPLMMLPERITREIGRLEGALDGRVTTLEHAIGLSIAKALLPITADIAALRGEVDDLKKARQQMTGVRQLGVFLVQTVIAAATALVGIITLGPSR